MRFDAFEAAVAASIRPVSDKCIAMLMAWHANVDTGEAWPGVECLALESSTSTAHVKRALRRLRESGVLHVVREARGGNKGRTPTVYRLDTEVLAQLNTDRGRSSIRDRSGITGESNRDHRRANQGSPVSLSGVTGDTLNRRNCAGTAQELRKAPTRGARASPGARSATPQDHMA